MSEPELTSSVPALVTLGQSLGLIRPTGYGPLGRSSELRLSVAGAESNVAIGVSRLGHPATWIGHVGDDPIGRMVLRELRAEGVTVHARVDPDRPTALMLAERRTADHTRMTYYRTAAAGVRLGPADITEAALPSAGILHVTGITACLGAEPAAAVQRAVELARERGLTVSVDLNHRLALADGPTFARHVGPLIEVCDIVFATATEAGTVLGRAGTPEEMAEGLHALGAAEVVLKFGADGSTLSADGAILRQSPARVSVVDTVGAGDAFAAGFVAARLGGADLAAQFEQAGRTAAISVSAPGDWEGLPTSDELNSLDPDIDISR